MKKFLVVIALILIAVPLCFSCGNPNKNILEVETRYQQLINKYKTEEAYFFGEKADGFGKTIVLKYNDPALENSILNGTGSDDISLRLTALNLVQGNILKYIFRYYENWNESFYDNLSMFDFEQKELNELYAKMEKLDLDLEYFKSKKNEFENEMMSVSIPSLKATVISQFTFEYNKIIESSIDFVEYFKDMHLKYIFSGKTDISNINSASRQLDDAYFSLAKFIYYSNVFVYNYSTGENGICDMLELMENRGSEFIYLNYLQSPLGFIGENISVELSQTVFNDALNNKLTNIKYTGDLFNQSLESYLSLYSNLDQYSLLRVRLNLVDGVTLDSFVNNFAVDEKIAYDNLYNLQTFLFPKHIEMIEELKI